MYDDEFTHKKAGIIYIYIKSYQQLIPEHYQ